MMIFDIIKVVVLALPLGIFLTFFFMVLINSAMKVRRADVALRKVLGYYCFWASVSSFMLLAYYYMPQLNAFLDIFYATSIAFSMVLFYRFFQYATKPKVRFHPLHYVIPSLLFIILFITKVLFPEMWELEGVRASLIIALLFGIVYSLLPLAEIYRYYIEQKVTQVKLPSINTFQATMYVVEVILFSMVFAFFPLIGGQTPGVLISSLIMVSILLALNANTPFSYAIIRHYTSFDTQQHSLFEEINQMETPTQTDILIERLPAFTEKKIKVPARKQQEKPLPPGFNKKTFNNLMRSQKPFLDPDLTIIDIANMLGTNRTYISEFVNRAYKMNFNSYINLLRLREMSRLMLLPKNKKRKITELIPQTGFGSYRNYLRAKYQFAKPDEKEAYENDDKK